MLIKLNLTAQGFVILENYINLKHILEMLDNVRYQKQKCLAS